MSLDWNEKAFIDHYRMRIRWFGPTDDTHPDFDPLNTGLIDLDTQQVLSRKGEPLTYGKDFAIYQQRDSRFGTDDVDNTSRTPFMFYARRGALIAQSLIALGGIVPATVRIMLVGSEFGYTLHGLKFASRHELISDDYPNAYGIDMSSYIETNMPTQQLADEGNIVFDDAKNAGTIDGDAKLTAVTGGATFDVVINGVTESFNLEGIETQLIDDGEGNLIMTATGQNNVLAVSELAALNTHLDACETLLTGADKRYIINLVDTPIPTDVVDDAGQPVVITGNEAQYDFLNSYGTTLATLDDWQAIRPSHSWLDIHSGVLLVGGA